MADFDGDLIDFVSTSHVANDATRRSYLVTCSQVDKTIFPTRESFAHCVSNAFDNAPGKVTVKHWACCLEKHKMSGEHYHMSVLLSGPRRWKKIKESVMANYGAVLHFSDKHDNYDWAYRYVCKVDKHVVLSPGHPNLANIGPPKTNRCINEYREKARKRKLDTNKAECSSSGSSTAKRKRLSDADVAKFVVAQNIKKSNELLAIAKERETAGNDDLYCFCVTKDPRRLSQIIQNVWQIEQAGEEVLREKMSRMEILHSVEQGECVDGCNGQWYECAYQVLTQNMVNPCIFAAAVRSLIEKGRGKFRNLMIIGPANTGKTFLLAPLQIVYKTFSNPANDKYGWVEADQAECIFLNDFRWTSELIAWHEFLLLLEGQKVHLPAPKNHFVKDICIDTDVPIFATGKARITYVGRYNSSDDRETEMMSVRWKIFEFRKHIPEHEQRDVPPCPKCFAKLVFTDEL